MTLFKRSAFFIEIISALLILLFVYTGTSKLLDRQVFRLVLSESPIIRSFSTIISVVLPIVELFTALLLIIPFTRKWGLLLSLLLLSVFTLYIAYMLVFEKYLPCSCGGVLKQMSWKEHLLFNIFFTAISAIGLWLYRRNNFFIAINPPSQGSGEAGRGS